MQLKDAVEKLLKDNNKTKSWLAESLGYALPTGVTNMLARGNVNLNTLCKICRLMDYEVTIQPKKKSGSRPKGQIILEERGDDK